MATSEYYFKHREERLAYQKSRYAKKQAALIAYQRAYQKANRDSERERAKSWRATNKDRANAAERARYAKQREKFSAKNKAWRLANAEALIIKSREYQKAHPEKSRARVEMRRARKLGARAEKIDFNKILRNAQGHCGICGKPFDLFGIHFDHKIPLSKGGTHTADNIQATHAYCNLSKGAKVG